jgi:DNA polymerase
MPPSRLHIDIETQSAAQLDKVGVYVYANHPSTRITCIACGLDNGRVALPVSFGGRWPREYSISGLRLAAHNAEFERVILSGPPGQKIGFPQTRMEQWVCTAAKASVHALPRKLEKCAVALGLDNLVDPTKRQNMLTLSKPKKDGSFWTPDTAPEKFQQWYADCITDVEAEREIDNLLPDLSLSEARLYIIDQEINSRGFKIDRTTVKAITLLRDEYVELLLQECMDICGHSPNQRDAVLNWLMSKGVELADYTSTTINAALDGKHKDERVLQIRRETGKTSVSKFDTMLRVAGADDRVRGAYMFHGASPGRWTGKLVQGHNLAKPVIEREVELADQLATMPLGTLQLLEPQVMDALSSCARPMIVADEGCELIASDFSSIESRITAWLCNETWKLEAFRRGDPIYEAVAARMFKKELAFFKDYKKKTGKHHVYRDLGKRTELMCGYAGGIAAVKRSPGFEKTGATDGEVQEWVDLWRTACPRTVAMWKGLERLIVGAIETGQVTQGYRCRFGLVKYANDYTFLRIQLPSGRSIYFAGPRVEQTKVVWNEEKRRYAVYEPDLIAWHRTAKVKIQREIGFWQQIKEQWRFDFAHGGIFLQNIVEAIGRDLLKNAMFSVTTAGYPITMHTHDELVAEVKKGTGSVKEFNQLMCKPVAWAEGLPLDAAGYRARRYHKD